jgi:hypothetical protein
MLLKWREIRRTLIPTVRLYPYPPNPMLRCSLPPRYGLAHEHRLSLLVALPTCLDEHRPGRGGLDDGMVFAVVVVECQRD